MYQGTKTTVIIIFNILVKMVKRQETIQKNPGRPKITDEAVEAVRERPTAWPTRHTDKLFLCGYFKNIIYSTPLPDIFVAYL